jgi:hypothetical protein
VLDVVPLSVATGNVRVYFTALSYSHRVVVTLKQWPLPCEARQMVVDPSGASKLPRSSGAVADLRCESHSVRYSLWRYLGATSESRWQALEFLTPTPGGRSEREV